jgi:predicted phage terminase large subunit-like protein
MTDTTDLPAAPSHRAIIKAAGVTRLAARLGAKRTTVSSWLTQGIPEGWWPALVEEGLAPSVESLRDGAERLGLQRKQVVPSEAAAPGEAPPPQKPPTRRALRAVRGAKGGLLAFTRLIDIPGLGPGKTAKLAAHHRLWLEKLEAVERGEIRRLMGFMPPGSAKSTYAVDVFTPWFLGRRKNRSVLVVTYATALAGRRGRKARSVTRQPVFAALMGTSPEKGRASAIDWGLDNGGEWMGAGMLAGITGNRADLIVVDDPVKGRAEADSELIRRRTREEFDDTVRTRLKAGGRIVLIQTRWHEDDLAGSLLPQDYDGRSGPVLCRDGEVWEVVSIPAQAERADDPLGRAVGDYLWPEYWGADHWPQFRLNPRTWNALYQQRPRPEEGSYFERSSFRRFQDHELPRALRYYGSSDYAVTEGGGDFTRLTVWGVDRELNLWRVASWGGQTSSDQWIERQCDLIADFRRANGGIRRWFGEAGVIQRAVEPMLVAKLRARRLSCPLEWLSSGQDKVTRARGAQALVREGRVFVRDDGDGDCFIDECVAFPAGRHDDEVDCLSLMGRAIDRVSGPPMVRGDLPEYAEMGDVFD